MAATLDVQAVNPPELDAQIAAVGNIVTIEHIYLRANTHEDGTVQCFAGARFAVGDPPRIGHVHMAIDHHGVLDVPFAALLRENMAQLIKRATRDGAVHYVAALAAGEDI